MLLKEIMTTPAEIIAPDTTLQSAAAKMKQLDVGALPVHDGGDRLAGMITDRDITINGVALGLDPSRTAVKELISRPIVYAFEDQELSEAVRIMESRQVRRLAVLNHDKRLVGIVSLGDFARRCTDADLKTEVLEKVSQPSKGPEKMTA